jgi:tetratricopeptide (TPR) repeat protein
MPQDTPVAGATPSPTPTPTPAPDATPTPTPSPSPDAAALRFEADAHFAQRSAGAVDEVANPQEVDAAIDLYRKALVLAPHNIDTLAQLMRALHFRGAYAGAAPEDKKSFFNEGRKLGQDAVDRLEAEAKSTRDLSRIEALRLVKGAPALYLWTAVHWGEWGLAKGKLASARGGVAGRLRDLSQTLIDLDPLFDDAAGYRMLGRLHAEAPRILFVTGWVSHEKGVQYLRRAYKAAPDDPVNCTFLAEGILDHEHEKKEEAQRVLEHCVSLSPRPEMILEDSVYIDEARAKLDQLRAGVAR